MIRTCLLLSLLAGGSALVLNAPEITSDEDSKYAVTNGKPVFYQIVMGSFPYRHQFKLWYAALRQVGKYNGTVVFVTDKPGCIARGLGEKFLGGAMSYTDKNVDVYPGTGDGKVHIIKVKKPRSIPGIKMHKSKAWANLAQANIDHAVSSIIYTDTDVLVGRDLSSFMAYEKTLEKKQHTLALFPDIGGASWEGGTGTAVHTGVVVMFPTKASQACLKEWGQQLGGGSDDPKPIHHFGSSLLETEVELQETSESRGVDQQALGNARICHKTGDGIFKMPAQYLNFPDEKSMSVGKTAQFVHITNTGRWKDISSTTKGRFFRRIGISKDIDWEKTGACPKEVWATQDYMERNHIENPQMIRALKQGKMLEKNI